MKMIRVIGVLFIVLLLFSACSRGDESSETKQPTVISIYVYTPDKPMVTRGDIGTVAPIDNTIKESTITKLQIWIFEANPSHNLVAYYSPESVDNLNESGATYQLSVSEAFAQYPENKKPNVDVYVIANVATSNCGFSFGQTTSRDDLEAALIQKDDTHDYFGLTTLTDRVPEAGLPMSGVLRNVEIGGASPVYRVGKESMETVTLTRAVSKIRFIFCREKPEDGDGLPVAINSIKLDESMIPTKENLFLESGENATAYRVSDFVFGDEKEFLSQTLSDICKSTNPLQYLYRSQVAQEYENLINNGVNGKELTQIGPFYLRESNKQLTGSITYQKDEEDENTVEFKMAEDNEGNYFSRNHTWIVYAYYSKSGLVAVNVLVKDWDNETEKSHSVYNW